MQRRDPKHGAIQGASNSYGKRENATTPRKRGRPGIKEQKIFFF